MYRLTDLVSSQELYHHGIKGQKWGRRRFQNEDGSLTPAGKERYDDDGPSEKKKEYRIPDNKSLHRLKLEDKYAAKGMSQKEAEQAAAKRIRGEQYAVAAATVTVAACIAYNKYKNYNTDKVLSSNTEFQRILKTADPDAPVRKGPRYVSFDKKDNMKYRGLYGDVLNKTKGEGEQVYKMTMKSNKDIKVASEKRARETFQKLYIEDAQFRKNFESRVYDNQLNFQDKKGLSKTIEKLAKKEHVPSKELKSKGYDLFNIMLVDSDEKGRSNANKFYNELAKQGMQAVGDMNDKKYSGYGTKNPLIMFDGDFDYKKAVMSNKEIAQQNNKAVAEVLKPTLLKAGAGYAAIFGTQPLMNKANIDKQVYLYRKEHPNTRMSDKEIIQLLQAEKNNKN